MPRNGAEMPERGVGAGTGSPRIARKGDEVRRAASTLRYAADPQLALQAVTRPRTRGCKEICPRLLRQLTQPFQLGKDIFGR